MSNQRLTKEFFTRAEVAWFKVNDSVDENIIFKVGKDTYSPLIPRFNSRPKILRYFRQFWSTRYSLIMLRNLQLKTINGRLCILLGNGGFFPYRVLTIRIEVVSPNIRLVRAILSDDKFHGHRIIYRVMKTKTGHKIIYRSNTKDDPRYDPGYYD